MLAEIICCLSWSASSVEDVWTLDHPRLLPKTCSCHSAFNPFTPAAKHQAPSSEILYACSIDLCHDSACAWQHHASTTIRPQSMMKDKTDPNSPKGPVSGRVIGMLLCSNGQDCSSSLQSIHAMQEASEIPFEQPNVSMMPLHCREEWMASVKFRSMAC